MSSTSAIDLPLEFHLQRLAVVALALADVAGDVDVGQEVHLDLDDAVALAGLAAAALDVEREAAGAVAARLGFRQAGEPVADRREGAGVGRGLERGVRPIGDWSMSMTLSICSSLRSGRAARRLPAPRSESRATAL